MCVRGGIPLCIVERRKHEVHTVSQACPYGFCLDNYTPSWPGRYNNIEQRLERLEARQNVFIIKASGNDSFYVWDTLPGNAPGSSIGVYDIDGNGYWEIVMSGNDETRIYEYDFGIEEYSGSSNKRDYHFPTVFTGPLLLPETVNCRVFDISGRTVVPETMKPGI